MGLSQRTVSLHPVPEVSLLASTSRWSSTAEMRPPRSRADSAYIWPPLLSSPNGVPQQATVERAGAEIAESLLPLLAPCGTTSTSCGEVWGMNSLVLV
jgi:hypothetical protein